MVAADDVLRTDERIEPHPLGEAAVFGEHRDPAVQTVDDLQPLGFDLLKLRRHLHHDRLELLLFQLQRRQIALKLLEPVLLDLQFIFC